MNITEKLKSKEVTVQKVLAALDGTSYRERRRFLSSQPRYPWFLYKYRSVDPGSKDSLARLESILIGSKLWLSSPIDFNDPFDITAHIIADGSIETKKEKFNSLLKVHRPELSWKDRAAEVSKLLARKDDQWKEVAKEAFEKSVTSMGVCSFASDPRSVLMWSHYAANHTGVCIQFEIARDPWVFLGAVGVDYDEEYPVVNWFEDTAEQLKAAILRKHRGWAYEGERRIVRPNSAHQPFSFRPEALTAIIVGCRATPELKNAIGKMVAERSARGMPKIKIYSAEKHSTKYALRLCS